MSIKDFILCELIMGGPLDGLVTEVSPSARTYVARIAQPPRKDGPWHTVDHIYSRVSETEFMYEGTRESLPFGEEDDR